MSKPILILDAGGVIIEDLAKPYWELILSHSNNKSITFESLYNDYKKQISNKLWTGEVSEDQLLQFLATYHITLTSEQLASLVANTLLPLPAFSKVKRWADKVSIFVMSNHRTAWLLPALEPIKPYLSDIYVSDRFNQKKPSIAWFNSITALHVDSPILFVDNTVENLDAAKQCGWNTLLADSQSKWITQVEQWLEQI